MMEENPISYEYHMSRVRSLQILLELQADDIRVLKLKIEGLKEQLQKLGDKNHETKTN